MTDIVVKVPRDEVDHFWHELLPSGDREVEEFWHLPAPPRRCGAGDWIWFQVGDQLVARARIDRVHPKASRICELTGRKWKGALVFWAAHDFEKLEHPMPGIPKFTRGVRYREAADDATPST